MTHDAVSRLSAKLNGPITLTPRKSVTAVSQAVRSFPQPTPPIEIDRELTHRLVPEQAILQTVPIGWLKGQLLNVRNNGAEFVVTVLGEEFDPRYPMRALKFGNSFECQAFISKWYAREHHDPRAF